jgi:hypothetical protein
MLYFESCLYAKNTTNAITRKLMILEIRSPYLKTVVVPAMFGTFIVSAAKLPAGRNRPIKGSIISFTKAFTSVEAACPITKAMASPIIPKVYKKSKNSWVNDLFFASELAANDDTDRRF